MLDVLSFREVVCDTDHYLMVAKVTERLTVFKQRVQEFDGRRFYFNQLIELEVGKLYQLGFQTGLQLWSTNMRGGGKTFPSYSMYST
jgi:hypothetical protein